MNITKLLAKFISNYQNPHSLGSYFSKRRAKLLVCIINSIRDLNSGKTVSILDVGGTRDYWNIIPIDWLRENKVKIYLLNLSPEYYDLERDVFEEMVGDGQFLPFPSKSFDICHSNSVIEHVKDMRLFAMETSELHRNILFKLPAFTFL